MIGFFIRKKQKISLMSDGNRTKRIAVLLKTPDSPNHYNFGLGISAVSPRVV